MQKQLIIIIFLQEGRLKKDYEKKNEFTDQIKFQ